MSPAQPSQSGTACDLIAAVQVPFNFFDRSKLTIRLELLDDLRGSGVQRDAQRPFDLLTAWVAFAYLGGIEKDGGWYFKPELDRKQRLKIASRYLSPPELLVVETIAVPQRYRMLPARDLEIMVQTAAGYMDRMWAACWLTLVGWTESPQCRFVSASNESLVHDVLEERIVEAYASSVGVSSKSDMDGWNRIDASPAANQIGRRLSICEEHYDRNGPPPYEYMCHTVPIGPGWKQLSRLVPEPSGSM
jgi:hypothetical protein